MKAAVLLCAIVAVVIVFYGFVVTAIPEATASVVSSSSSAFSQSTTSITGYAIPNAAGLGYGLIPFFLPIAIMSLFGMFAYWLNLGGEINSFIIKTSLFIGTVLGMLSMTSTAPTLMPIGFPVVTGVYLLTYLWKRT